MEETPETWDALLAVLVEHRRADDGAGAVSGGLLGGKPGNDGQTLYIGGGRRILTWAVPSGELPGIVLELSAEGWDGWHGTDASPTEPRGGHGGFATRTTSRGSGWWTPTGASAP